MTKRARKTARAAAGLGEMFMLAPAVMAMRMPMMMKEAMAPESSRTETNRATSEKVAAAAEGLAAAQLSLAHSASRFWLEAMTGRVPSILSGAAAVSAFEAALSPSSSKVRGNYRRLSKATLTGK